MRPLFYTLPIVLIASPVYAAELLMYSSGQPVRGQDVAIRVEIDTEGEAINALEGSIAYPSHLTLKDIRDGNSLVNFWAERPFAENNTITFAGIVPGGYRGVGAEVFTLVFEAHEEKDAAFVLTDARALMHDGEGTPTPLTLHPTIFALSDGARARLNATDTTPPESFTPQRGVDPSLYEGKTFVVFATQDKDSGVASYEVAESPWYVPHFLHGLLSWQSAQSPHALRRDTSYVFVRAYDAAGNARTEVLPGSFPIVPAFVLVVIILLVYISRKLYVRNRSK